MNRFHYIVKSINVLNCLLTLLVAIAVNNILFPFMNIKIRTILPAVGKTALVDGEQKSSQPLPVLAAYAAVSEQNLFHPERKMPVQQKAEPPKIVIPKPELVLYGTLVADDLSIAYVEDKKAPFPASGRDKRMMKLKKGDSVNGYVLQEIDTNRIVLVKDGDRLTVVFDEKNKKRSSDTAASAVGQTASAGGQTAAAAGQAVPGSLTPRGAIPAAFPAAANSPATAAAPSASGLPSVYQAATSSPATSLSQPGTALPSPTAANPAGTNISGSSKSNTVLTPTVTRKVENLPARSQALSDMLSTTPAGVRSMMQAK